MAVGGDINDRLAELAARVAAVEQRLNEIAPPKKAEPVAAAQHEEARHSTGRRR